MKPGRLPTRWLVVYEKEGEKPEQHMILSVEYKRFVSQAKLMKYDKITILKGNVKTLEFF